MPRKFKPKDHHWFASLEDALKFKPVIYTNQYAIDNSIRKNKRWCMFSRGVAYTLPDAIQIVVSEETTRFSLAGYRFTYDTPPVVAFKVVAYDEGKTIRPWKVQLQRPIGVKPSNNRPPNLQSAEDIAAFKKKRARIAAAARRKTDETGIEHSEITGKPVKKWTGKYKAQYAKRKCGSRTSRRWHGLVIPKGMQGGRDAR